MAEKKMSIPLSKNTLNHHLKHFVGFGDKPQHPAQPNQGSMTGRLQELVRKVEDLNRRVDRLKNQF